VVAARPGNAAWPFCGERCRAVDLDRWLSEEFRIPTEEQPGEGEGAAGASVVSDERGERRQG
jgi:endogenous inhibitor of DNA gyrase (YacG/DUF329 family)